MPLQATSGAASYDAFGGGVAAVPNYIEDVFSTWLYTGTGATQTITNGIDLSGKGGLTWIKLRNDPQNHFLFDTNRGALNELNSNNTEAQASFANSLTAFNFNGFSLGSSVMNSGGGNYASWTFREQPKFFDVVTWTGNGANRTIAHNLGSVPGCIMVKRTDTTGAWQVYHRGLANTQYVVLNSFATVATGTTRWNSTTPTSTVFSLGTDATVNASGGTYVAYLFAHDAGGFGLTGTDNVISCGSYTGTASTLNISLGYEPQWVLVKNTSQFGYSWFMYDTMRGIPTGGNDSYLLANESNAEAVSGDIEVNATGFTVTGSFNTNYSGDTYIYIAIRRGPMKVPTTGTSVFSPNAIGASSIGTPVTTNFPVDLQIATWRGGTGGHYLYDRLRRVSSTTTEGAQSLETQSTAAEASVSTATRMWGNTGYQVDTSWSNAANIYWNFQRAPGFFDEVCYTGTGSATTRTHNLGVSPEFIIVKQRSGTATWVIKHTGLPVASVTTFVNDGDFNSALVLNSTSILTQNGAGLVWQNSSVFYSSTDFRDNSSGQTYVAYLFASCPGVSKVFSYTGNGSSQTINCGFTGGARFVMIKRTDSTGDWYVWDTARGIVAGNDPHLSLNSTAAEVTSNDTIDTDSTGFVVNQVAATNVNVNAATYIGLAIA
jgi:hypothetical protein